MNAELGTYLELGLQHILDLQGYDHMLYLLALCAGYQVRQWRSILLLATAFTIGHSITLALSIFDLVSVSMLWVEWLIPVTIAITAAYEWRTDRGASSSPWLYILTVAFGCIHGLGFSSFLRSLFDDSSEIVIPLLGFNLGLEVGQLVFVSLVLGLAYLLIDKVELKPQVWSRGLSTLAMVVSIYLIIDRWPW